ncbi:MAG: hypothetical protein ACM3SO_19395 [Betaproteobacteria bacterium]
MTAPRPAAVANGLARLGAIGVATTLVVLAVSVWLRVNTSLDAAGNAVSSLGTAGEQALRGLHRVAASATGLVAIVAAVLVARYRPRPRGQLAALALVISMTLALAAAGRFTAGYRLPGITIVNVAAGIALAAGFLWLRLSAPGCVPGVRPRVGFAGVALCVAFVHSALGAAASAHTMHRASISLEPWHVGLGFAVTAVCVVAAARDGGARGWRLALALAALAQLGTGMWLSASGETFAPATAWFHAALAAAVVLMLLRIAVR